MMPMRISAAFPHRAAKSTSHSNFTNALYTVGDTRISNRVIQYKMILKQSLIPMQDDPENGRIGVGKPLGNAHQNAACGKSYQFTNRRVFEGERGNRIQRAKPHGGL